ncbi:hypothetical protein RUND412_005092 [Rhizina undulata]
MENEHLEKASLIPNPNIGAKPESRDGPLSCHFPELLAASTTNLVKQPTEDAEPHAAPVPIAVEKSEVRGKATVRQP